MAGYPGSAQLTRQREYADRFLPDRCTIYRQHQLSSTTTEKLVRHSNKPCRLQTLSGGAYTSMQALAPEADMKLTLSMSVSGVEASDIVAVTNGNTGVVTELQVVYMPAESSQVSRLVYCKVLNANP